MIPVSVDARRYYGAIRYPYVIEDIGCDGYEKEILDCWPIDYTPEYCDPYDLAGLRCYECKYTQVLPFGSKDNTFQYCLTPQDLTQCIFYKKFCLCFHSRGGGDCWLIATALFFPLPIWAICHPKTATDWANCHPMTTYSKGLKIK